MRLPRACYPFLEAIEPHLPSLRAAQQRGLALGVVGTLLAENGCQSAVPRALRPLVGREAQHAVRHRLREWMRDGADQALPAR